MPAFDYQTYLASREWAVKREAVRARSGNRCERILGTTRCPNPHQSTHHTTYARIGHELLEDLLAVCHDCHRWLSGKLEHDPLAALIVHISKPQPSRFFSLADSLMPCAICEEMLDEDYFVSLGTYPHRICGPCRRGLERQDKLNWDVVDCLHVSLAVRRYFDECDTL